MNTAAVDPAILAEIEALPLFAPAGGRRALPAGARHIAEPLARTGASLEAIMCALRREYADAGYGYASYANAASEARMQARHKGAETMSGAPPAPAFVPMHPDLVAFAQARDFRCAYCARRGSRAGDPNGAAWHRDLITARQAGTTNRTGQKVLACSACKNRADRVLIDDSSR